jgi:hypothetical protein
VDAPKGGRVSCCPDIPASGKLASLTSMSLPQVAAAPEGGKVRGCWNVGVIVELGMNAAVS